MAKHPEGTDHSRGGPGSSHQDATEEPRAGEERKHPSPGAPTHPDRSRISGGGGERDRHHTHDPSSKS
jgi:hypothetical protein